MQLREKVDRTLVERQAVQEIVHRVRDEAVTLQELEQIGARLRCSGVCALNTLLRALAREEDPDLIARYAYLLDFFEQDQWLTPLMGIALKRRDLPEQGRAALLTALQEYGVDVDDPPFRNLLPPHSRIGVRDEGEVDDDALTAFLDDFLNSPAEVQRGTLRELSREREPWVVRLLEALLWHEEREVVEGALDALGRIATAEAAAAVAEFLEECDPSFAAAAQLAVRRLSFQGIATPAADPPLPFHDGYVSAPDADGYRSILISRWEGGERLSALYLQVHERRGLLAAWGGEGLDVEAFEEEVETFGVQEELHRVAPEYVVALVRDALHWSRDLSYLPADFYLRRRLFKGVDLSPVPYRPRLEEYAMRRSLTYLEGERIAAELLEDPFFAGWPLLVRRVYELAQEYRHGAPEEAVLETLCAELLAPQAELIAERLLAIADLMAACGGARDRVVQVVALARSLQSYRLPCHLHPFLRRCAQESIHLAADALEGEGGRAAGA